VDTAKCRRCGSKFKPEDTGRPPKYCSDPCRRAAEYDLRRQQQLLVRAEKAYQDARLKAATMHGTHWAGQAEWWRLEVERLEDYLFESLALDE
jgi:hypothetical protein